MQDKEYHPTAVKVLEASEACYKAEEGADTDEGYEALERAEAAMERAVKAWREAGSPELPPDKDRGASA